MPTDLEHNETGINERGRAMITVADIRTRVWDERPFLPFRMHLKDGRSFDIVQPRWNLVADVVMMVGVGLDDPRTGFPDRLEMVYYGQIDRLEPLPLRRGSTC